ncbi:hybrid sensor histidine kinase/response regulator [Candidatus Halobeggiatoa sp. HSG11]|nr:hybrid sensor histidine kinase/response regulator [Candidatus Halobeggiatoa sp. HSG11]
MNKQQTILIVDDNPENLALLGNILTKKDYILGFASNGTTALNIAHKKCPDLVLLDVMMPDVDGFEVCKQLKQDTMLADIPIIFLTAKTEKDDVIAGLKLGAVDYVTKPFNEMELLTRVNTHLELQATKKELRESLATKDKFFSIVAHDLNNAFSGLIGLTSALTDNNIQHTAERKDEYIQYLHQAAEKGYNLLTNLLQWSRSQTGSIQINPVVISLQYIVHKNVQLLQEKAKVKNINLFSQLDEDALSMFADVSMLDTVIRNLLSNAVKFTNPYGVIKVTSEKSDNMVELSIIDDGVGIEFDDIDKLFRMDISHSTIGTDKETGNGLGLMLCKEFIEKNGGVIGVESEIGKGSRFYVRLPIELENK